MAAEAASRKTVIDAISEGLRRSISSVTEAIPSITISGEAPPPVSVVTPRTLIEGVEPGLPPA